MGRVMDTNAADDATIRTESIPDCPFCGRTGVLLYEALRDRLFSAPGAWNVKRCPGSDCGLLWLDPMPVEEDIHKAYRDYYTHKDRQEGADKPIGAFKRIKREFRSARGKGYLASRYGMNNGASAWERFVGFLTYFEPIRKGVLDFKTMYLRPVAGGRLLEIGCGNGRQLEFLRDLGWMVEGVDPDPTALAAASARGLTVHMGTLAEQGFPAEHFDAIVSSHVIEHVHDPVGLLRECRRILRPGGRLVIVTPNTASLGHRLFGADWLDLDPPRHLHLFNLASLRRAATDAGLVVSWLTSTVRDADGTFRASRDIRTKGRHDWGSRHATSVRRWSKVFQWTEWVVLQAGLNRGEELAMACAPGLGKAQDTGA